MKKIIPLLNIIILIALSFCSRAQTYNIVRAQAFFRTSTAGNIPVDEGGSPTSHGVTKDYLIYLETKGLVLPQWETAYINGLPFSIRTVAITQTPVTIGALKGQKTPVIITKAKDHQLWQLVFSSQQNAEDLQSSEKTQVITLRGTFRNKPITYKIPKAQELAKRFHP